MSLSIKLTETPLEDTSVPTTSTPRLLRAPLLRITTAPSPVARTSSCYLATRLPVFSPRRAESPSGLLESRYSSLRLCVYFSTDHSNSLQQAETVSDRQSRLRRKLFLPLARYTLLRSCRSLVSVTQLCCPASMFLLSLIFLPLAKTSTTMFSSQLSALVSSGGLSASRKSMN